MTLTLTLTLTFSDTDWFSTGKEGLSDLLKLQNTVGRAKNVVILVGDGMGVSTVTAARIYKGQLAGRTGEEEMLNFDKFPNVALAKVDMFFLLIVQVI